MNTEYYQTLGVGQKATPAEIKKAYHKLAIKNHPDKGGDPERFKEIATAYNTLSNPEKRIAYDRFGKEGLQANGNHFPDANDIFSMFFGGNRHMERTSRKGKDVVHPLEITLEDLYNGKIIKISVLRYRIKYPDDKSVHDAVIPCHTCEGKGTVVQMHRMGPIVHQSHTSCSTCGGTGKILANFATKIKERKILEIQITPGMKDREQIKFHGESDEHPGIEPGDIIFILREKKHEQFQRRGSNLMVTKEISLAEALCGTTISVKHLDQREIYICTTGEIITPGEIRCVENEGMPQAGNSRGKLFIVFMVRFPENLTSKQKKMFRKILPLKHSSVSASNRQIYTTTKVDKSTLGI